MPDRTSTAALPDLNTARAASSHGSHARRTDLRAAGPHPDCHQLDPGGGWLDAARLVRRTGFGATGAEVGEAVKLGTEAYATAALAADPTKDPGVLATPVPEFETVQVLGKDADAEAKKAAKK